MRKVYLEGMLGEKFGSEWNLAVNSPAEAIQAIAAQRSGFKQYLIEGENVQGYDVLIGDEQVSLEECMLTNPSMSQSYTFVPVIAGSKNAGIMMILGIALIAMTGGFAALGYGGLAAGGLTGTASGLTGAALTTAVTAGQVTAAGLYTATGAVAATAAAAGTMAGFAMAGASYLGMGLLLGGASMLLAPETPDSTSGASKAQNYLFSGPVNTVKQGQPIPLVYGRMITGSKTIMASLFTTTSNNESQNLKTRKLVGIEGFRDDGDMHGENAPAGRYIRNWSVSGLTF